MKRSIIVFVVVAGCAVGAFATGLTETLDVTNQTQEITYNSAVGLQLAGSIEIEHAGPAKEFFLTIGTGQSGTFTSRLLSTGTDDLTYQIYGDAALSDVIKDLSVAPGSSEVLWGSADEYQGLFAQIVTLPYFIVIPAGQSLAAGSYNDSLTLSLYSGTLAAPVLESTAALSVTGPVANNITLNLVAPGAAPPRFGGPVTDRAMDLGELSPGVQGATDLLVEANCAFTVALESANSGFLAHADLGNPSLIPYVLEFAGAAVDFSGGGAVVVGTSPGYRYPIVVTVGELGTASSGTYEDTITISVTAQ